MTSLAALKAAIVRPGQACIHEEPLKFLNFLPPPGTSGNKGAISFSDSDRRVTANSNTPFAFFPVNRILRSGVHYFEFEVHSVGNFNLNCDPPLSSFWGVTDASSLVDSSPKFKDPQRYGFANYRATLNPEGGERMYGEIVFHNRTIGMLVDVNEGEIYFDTVDLGFLMENPQGVCDWWHPLGLANLPRLPDVLVPMVGLKHSGASVELRSKHYSITGRSSQLMLHSLSTVSVLAPLLADYNLALPDDFLRQAYSRWCDWHLQKTQRHLVRPGKFEIDFDVRPDVVRKFGFLAGDEMSTPHGDAVVVGVFADNLWFQVKGHDQWGAWYVTKSELDAPGTEYRLIGRTGTTASSTDLLARYVSFEMFCNNVYSLNPAEFGDADIVRAVDSLSLSTKTQNLRPGAFLGQIEKMLAKAPHLTDKPSPLAISCRFMVLFLFNELLFDALPLIDFDRTPIFGDNLTATSSSASEAELDALSLGAQISAVRHLVFMETKNKFFQDLLLRTRVDTGVAEDAFLDHPQSIQEYSVDRLIHLYAIADQETRLRKSLLWQLYTALGRPNPDEDHPFLRQQYIPVGREDRQPRAFRLRLQGEEAADEGGPYREVFVQIFDQLHSRHPSGEPTLPYFQPCPNAKGGDRNTHLWIANAQRSSDEDVGVYFFIGVLIGMAVRHNIPLPNIQWPRLYWKSLVGEPATLDDVAQFDTHFTSGMYKHASALLARLEAGERDAVDEELADDLYHWEVLASTGKVVPLRPDAPAVTSDELKEFVDAMLAYRLAEFQTSLDAVSCGLRSIIPTPVLALFTHRDLETLVTGPVEIDVDRLRQHTRYESIDPSAPYVRYFWEVLQEMDDEERAEFLQFAWSRSRLPLSDDQWDRPLTIKGSTKSDPDSQLPTVRTCFFTLTLPAYSSKSILREKLDFVKGVREQDLF